VVTRTGAEINKKRLSITVDAIISKDIEKTPTRQLDQLLLASAPSAQIKLSPEQLVTNSIIRTRGPLSANGNKTPVIIVDGIRVDNLNSNASLELATGDANSTSTADIPRESIEKIEYVKGGAATTLHGVGVTNGVIQIITKKGSIGKTGINFEVETGIISGTEDFLRFKKTGNLLFTDGTFQNYRIGFNGGTEKFKHKIAGSMYVDESFNTVNEQYKTNIRAGFTAKINDELTYQSSSVFSTLYFTRDYNANSGISRFSNSEGGDFADVDALSDHNFNDLKVQNQLEADLTDITDRIR
jgi:outer membrane receptor for ferrienterochelin and colicin